MFVPFSPENLWAIILSPHPFRLNPPFDDFLTVPTGGTVSTGCQCGDLNQLASQDGENKRRLTGNKTTVINQVRHDRKTDGRMHMSLSDTVTAVVPVWRQPPRCCLLREAQRAALRRPRPQRKHNSCCSGVGSCPAESMLGLRAVSCPCQSRSQHWKIEKLPLRRLKAVGMERAEKDPPEAESGPHVLHSCHTSSQPTPTLNKKFTVTVGSLCRGWEFAGHWLSLQSPVCQD